MTIEINKLELWQLKQRQSLPLNVKIELTKRKILNFYNHYGGKVYVAYSGGKDSEVLLHLAKQINSNIERNKNNKNTNPLYYKNIKTKNPFYNE
jgi:3'-phosphoadenosine 5'-phosphosulfate sulfotransferase (PAPS reductase)/FAD synthetase